MAFKISSIEKMRGIAQQMVNSTTSLQTTSSRVISSIDEIVETISGKGVDQTLNKLRTAVDTETKAMQQLLTDISQFIYTQVTSYANNEEEAKQNFTSIDTALDGIKF